MGLIIYLFWINVFSYLLYVEDKHRAYLGEWRIPEWLLILIAFICGALGSFMAMLMFRHKTRHKKFMISVPIFLVVQIIISVLSVYFKWIVI